jgi:DUF438 domain-containing protein
VTGLVEANDDLAFDTGTLTAEQINLILTHLPADITFVDERDAVRYYSATKEPVFAREPGIIGRPVQECHPPQNRPAANRLLEEFKAGTRDAAESWVTRGEQFLYIRYIALRDGDGNYRGTMEVSQEVPGIRALEGEHSALDS